MADPSPAESRPSRARLLAAVSLWSIVTASVAAASGCYGRICDGDVQFYGRNPGEGRLIGPDEWESSPIDGKWLPFPRQRAWVFQATALGDRVPHDIIPYISAQETPNTDPGGNFTHGAGNLAEIFGIGNGQFIVKNGTCADYYIRVTAEAPPRPPAAAPAGDAAAPP